MTEAVRRTVEEQLGFIATVTPDGSPSLSPKGTIAVWDDDHLVFAHVRSPGTFANLQSNPSIEVNVVDPLTRAGYRIRGVASVHVAGEQFEQGVGFYRARGMPGASERIRAIVIIEVHGVRRVVSPAYDLGATEAELRQLWLERISGSLGPPMSTSGGGGTPRVHCERRGAPYSPQP